MYRCTALHVVVSSFVKGNASLGTVQKIIGVSPPPYLPYVENNEGETPFQFALKVRDDGSCWSDRRRLKSGTLFVGD